MSQPGRGPRGSPGAAYTDLGFAAWCRAAGRRHRCGVAVRAARMSERDLTSPNWRSLRDAIAFVSRHLTVRKAETELRAALVSCDLPSIRERADGVREPLTGWGEIDFSITSYIDHPRELMRDDDIEIVRGFELLDPNLIFVWWPKVERLCGLTVAQPGPVPKSESAASAPPTAESGASTSASTPSAPAPAAGDQRKPAKTVEERQKPKDWLRISKRNHPKAKDERHHAWAERQLQLMNDAHALGKVRSVWTLENMIRRLRDKDAED